MKRIFLGVFCILLGMLALAGEVALLLYTQRNFVSERRQGYAAELKDEVVKISASLRMGEAEHFEESLASFDNTFEKFSPYLEEDEKAKLTEYRAALGSIETGELMALNAKLLKVKASMEDPQVIEDLGDEPELKKLNEALLKLKTCEVYCSAEDYKEIENTLTDESEKLSQKVEAKEQANAVRLGSEELIAWLDMLK